MMRKAAHGFAFGATVAAVSLLLAACSSSGKGTDNGGGGGGGSPSAMPTTTAGLYTEAKKEGSVSIYADWNSDEGKAFVDAFKKAYPGISVNLVAISGSDLEPRILTEQQGGKYNADVVELSSELMGQLQVNGALESYDPPDQPSLPSTIDLPAGNRGVWNVDTDVIAYNPKVLKQQNVPIPTSFADFAKPAWKGHFSINPGIIELYDPMVADVGHDQALELFKKIGDNSPVLVDSHTQAALQVQSGEQWASMSVNGQQVAPLHRQTPDTLGFTIPKPLYTVVSLMDIAKNAPHPAAARLLMNWMASQPAQQLMVKTTSHSSIRTDVTNDKSVWDPTKYPPKWTRLIIPSDTYNSELKEYQAALHASG